MDFKKERVNSHNNWPEIKLFKAEQKFRELLEKRQPIRPFQQANLQYGSDPDYQKMIGHFLNGLEALPDRPDYMFDHCFTVIDRAASPLFPSKGITGIVEGLGKKLMAQSPVEWEGSICRLALQRSLSVTSMAPSRTSKERLDSQSGSSANGVTEMCSHRCRPFF
ncbi:hypothetical protein [Burkholderia ambifaria]|uniref:hypothetical protein n=1 Tax=Burkholderia ambifaria TaxID=152480 RepID=UPI00158D6AD7|nr:hypothetical protein [Burkholderia ambifaria]